MKYYSLSAHEIPHTWQTEAILPDQAAALKRMAITGLTLRCLIEPSEMEFAHQVPAVSVRSNCPVPNDLVMYYFEACVLNKGVEGKIAIGFSADGTEINDKLPGWTAQSYGYHGDDGCKFTGGGNRGTAYGPTFSAGDTIGVLLNRAERTISFYKNGIDLGVAFRDVALQRLYPTVGCCTLNEEVSANFGAQPFHLDIDALQRDYLARLLGTITATALPKPPARPDASPAAVAASLLPKLVFDYLIQHRCLRTAEVVARDLLAAPSLVSPASTSTSQPRPPAPGGSSKPAMAPAGWGPEVAADIEARTCIYDAVVAGDLDGALALVSVHYGADCLAADPKLAFRLKVQKLVQLVPSGPEAALAYGRAELSLIDAAGVRIVGPEEEELLRDALSLLAYEQPETSPCGQLLGAAHRRGLAEELNSALLRARGRPAHCGLERTYQQAVVAVAELRAAGNVTAHLLDVRRLCLQGAGPRPARPLPVEAPSADVEKLPGSPAVRVLPRLDRQDLRHEALRELLARGGA